MNRARVRRLAATVTIGSLLAIQAFAGAASAAIPSAVAVSKAIPAEYTVGNSAGFRGTYLFTDPSTLAKLFLRIDLQDPETATNDFYKVTRTTNGVAKDVTNLCSLEAATQDVLCTFKTVRAGDFFVAVAGWVPPNVTPPVPEVVAAFVWSSTGVPDNEDSSHGDDWDAIPLHATLSVNGNYGGGLSTNNDTTIGNAPIGPGNVQSTKLVGLPKGVAATVLDGPNVPQGTCTTTEEVDCDALFGESVEVVVDEGLTQPLFQIQITYAAGTPKGFVHWYTVDGLTFQEFAGPCAKKVADREYPCFTWAANTKTATIFTTRNGTWKGS